MNLLLIFVSLFLLAPGRGTRKQEDQTVFFVVFVLAVDVLVEKREVVSKRMSSLNLLTQKEFISEN